MIKIGTIYYHKRLKKLVKVLQYNKSDVLCIATTALDYSWDTFPTMNIGKVYGMTVKIQELSLISRLLGILYEI